MDRVPSGWQIEHAMTALIGARQRLLADDPSIEDDDHDLFTLIEGDFDVRGYAEVVRQVFRCAIAAEEVEADLDQRIARLQQRRERARRRGSYLRTTGQAMLEALDLDRVQAPDFTAFISKPRNLVIITDESQIPNDYCKVERTVRKRDVGIAMKAGVEVPGAMFANGIPVLTIRKT
jgi:hypothetical protein